MKQFVAACPKQVLLPNGDLASTTCIDIKKLLRVLGWCRDVERFEWVPLDAIELLSGIYANTQHLTPLLEQLKECESENPTILTVMDREGHDMAVLAVLEDNVEEFLGLLAQEFSYDVITSNPHGSQVFSYKMFLKTGSGVMYDVCKDTLVEVATRSPVNVIDVRIKILSKGVCEQWRIPHDEPIDLIDILLTHSGKSSVVDLVAYEEDGLGDGLVRAVINRKASEFTCWPVTRPINERDPVCATINEMVRVKNAMDHTILFNRAYKL